jgi:hypothetical protein
LSAFSSLGNVAQSCDGSCQPMLQIIARSEKDEVAVAEATA